MGRDCSSAENCPRRLVFYGSVAVVVGVGSGSNDRCPCACALDHLPCTCAPHATLEASVLSANYIILTFSFGPQGRPSSDVGGSRQ